MNGSNGNQSNGHLRSSDLPWRPLWCGTVHIRVSPCFLQLGRWWSPVPSAPRRRWSWSQPRCLEQTHNRARWELKRPKLNLSGIDQCGFRSGACNILRRSPEGVNPSEICSFHSLNPGRRLTQWASFLLCLRCSHVLSVRRACRTPGCRTAGPGSWTPVPEPPCNTE